MKKIGLFLLIALLVCSLFTGCRRMNDTTGVGTTGKPSPAPSTTGIVPLPTMTSGTTAPSTTKPATTAPTTTAPGSTGMARGHRGPRY